MEISLSTVDRIDTVLDITATAGKRSYDVFASFDDSGKLNGMIHVCCLNAAHRIWAGQGRQFRTVEEALAGYKAETAKEAISSAWDALVAAAAPTTPAKTVEADAPAGDAEPSDFVSAAQRYLSSPVARRARIALRTKRRGDALATGYRQTVAHGRTFDETRAGIARMQRPAAPNPEPSAHQLAADWGTVRGVLDVALSQDSDYPDSCGGAPHKETR